MSRNTRWIGATAVVMAAIVAAGWFLLISPQRSQASDLARQRTVNEAQNQTLRATLQRLIAQNTGLPAVIAKIDKIKVALPDNAAMPSLIRNLSAAESSVNGSTGKQYLKGLQIESLTPGASVPVTLSTTPTGTPAAAGAAKPAAINGATVLAVPFTLRINGNYWQLEQYLSKLEAMNRAVMVTGFTMTANSAHKVTPLDGANATSAGAVPVATTDPLIELTITARVFVFQPNPTAAVAPVAPVAPSASTATAH